jgi:hypothetical protein
MSELPPVFVPITERQASRRSAYEVVADVVRSNSALDSLTLVTYSEAPNWRDLNRKGETADVESLVNGLKQDRGERTLTRLSRKDISAVQLRTIADNLPKGRLIGVVSRVLLTGGGAAHIPMMDFLCVPSARNLEMLTHLLGDLRQGRGCLLESGRSYHYYGYKLLTEDGLKIFLGKCLLMSGFADDRYIGHQLVDGHCVLRLSSGTLKPSVPTVVAEIS